jgi:ABC-type branched-subunit amino acid transport system ATPase component
MIKKISRIIWKKFILCFHAQGATVILMEQRANEVLSIANRGYAIETGEIDLRGDAKALK